MESNADKVVGSVVRKKTEIIRIECQLTGDISEDLNEKQEYTTKDWNGVSCFKKILFLFKYFQSPGGGGFDYLPRLIREPVLFRPGKYRLKSGTGTLKLGSTIYDPLSEIPVKKVTSMTYGFFNNTMLPGKVVARVWNPFRFLRHAFSKLILFPNYSLEGFSTYQTIQPNQVDLISEMQCAQDFKDQRKV